VKGEPVQTGRADDMYDHWDPQ